MENDAYAGAGRLQYLDDAKYFLGKPSRRPSQSGILHEYPGASPPRSHKFEDIQRFRPAVNFPRHAANLQLDVVILERVGEIAAVFLDGVGRLVFAAEERNGGEGH